MLPGQLRIDTAARSWAQPGADDSCAESSETQLSHQQGQALALTLTPGVILKKPSGVRSPVQNLRSTSSTSLVSRDALWASVRAITRVGTSSTSAAKRAATRERRNWLVGTSTCRACRNRLSIGSGMLQTHQPVQDAIHPAGNEVASDASTCRVQTGASLAHPQVAEAGQHACSEKACQGPQAAAQMEIRPAWRSMLFGMCAALYSTS